jgi:hypothetical protein
MGHRTILLRLSAVLRNAVVMCRPLITPDNCWHKTTWPEFQPSLPPGQDEMLLKAFDTLVTTVVALMILFAVYRVPSSAAYVDRLSLLPGVSRHPAFWRSVTEPDR